MLSGIQPTNLEGQFANIHRFVIKYNVRL